jgi:hypothetical protein
MALLLQHSICVLVFVLVVVVPKNEDRTIRRSNHHSPFVPWWKLPIHVEQDTYLEEEAVDMLLQLPSQVETAMSAQDKDVAVVVVVVGVAIDVDNCIAFAFAFCTDEVAQQWTETCHPRRR